MRFRKKPVVVEAVRVAELLQTAAESWRMLPQWFRKAYDNGNVILLDKALLVKTLEGDMTANIDDWLIQGVKGELYPCKPDIFGQTYEEAQ